MNGKMLQHRTPYYRIPILDKPLPTVTYDPDFTHGDVTYTVYDYKFLDRRDDTGGFCGWRDVSLWIWQGPEEIKTNKAK